MVGLDQPRQEVHETPSHPKKLGMVVHACHPSYCGKHIRGGLLFQTGQDKKQELTSKITRAKMTGVVAQVVQGLPSKQDILSITKKKKKSPQ
jgi:hypothetical protein